jgi:tetratricopeptide (TPR) repeat protein
MSKRKPIRFPLIGFLLLLACALALTGCALFGPSVEKAREIAALREGEAAAAVEAYAKAAKDLEDVVARYEAAVQAGDKSAAEALAVAVREAVARYQSAKDVAESSRNLFNAAAEDLKKAQSTSDYIGTVFGWVLAGIGGLFGAGGLFGRAKAKEALGGVTNALEKVKNADGDVWPAAKADMQATLSTGALRLIDKVRPR